MLKTHCGMLDVREERRRLGVPFQFLYGEIVDLERRFQVHQRELRLSNSLSKRSESDKQLIKAVLARYRDLPREQRWQWPALLNAIGKLAVLAGDFESARQDFEELAALVPDPKVQAEAHYNAYVVALERSQWTEALAALRRALALHPQRFAPFPVGKYSPQRILGAGGFCVAFLCRQQVTGSLVVIKGMLANDSEDDRAKLVAEAQVLEEVKHPAVIRLRDCDYLQAGGSVRPYLVMDYFQGPTLEEYVHKYGPLAPEDLLALARPVADALRAAHARGIVHRDVKPGNILVRRVHSGWRVKLIDFGLALKLKQLPLTAGATPDRSGGHDGGIVGTLDYAAPEQLGHAEGTPVGPYSDVYGFGKTCYYALLGTAKPTDKEKATLAEPWRQLLAGCTGWSVPERFGDFAPVLAQMSRMCAGARTLRRERKAVACLRRAQNTSDRGEHERTIAELSRALRLEPNLATAYNNRGIAYSNQGEHGRAVVDFSEALRIDPGLTEAYHNRGLAYASQGVYAEAIADFTRALSLNPEQPATYVLRGMAHGNQGDLDLAVADFTEAIRLNPADPVPYYHRATVYAKKGDADLARLDYDEAARQGPALAKSCDG